MRASTVVGTLIGLIGFVAATTLAFADTRNFIGDSTTCPSGAFTGQISTTLNPAGTTNTQASISSNPAACGANEILLDAVVGSTTTFSTDCEGDTYTLADLTVAGADITGANSESINIGGTDATFKFVRNTSGIVLLTAADDDATAALTVLPGGAAAGVFGGASMTSFTVTTDSTGNGEVVLPAASIGEAELTRPGRWKFKVCGDATTVNNNTVYYGPSLVIAGSATAGQITCDTTAAGNVTEATADTPVLTGTAFAVSSMVCTSDSPGTNLTFTLRSAAAAITPAIACTVVSGAAGTCVANVQSTTDIASGAAVAVAVSSTGDIGTVKFICDVEVVF